MDRMPYVNLPALDRSNIDEHTATACVDTLVSARFDISSEALSAHAAAEQTAAQPHPFSVASARPSLWHELVTLVRRASDPCNTAAARLQRSA